MLRAEVAGSARRRVDSVKDLDIVVASDDPAAVVTAFAGAGAARRMRPLR